MKLDDNPDSWSIHEAISVAFQTFASRFGADILWAAFEALTAERELLLEEHYRWESDIDSYLRSPLNLQGKDLVMWIASARADTGQERLLLHVGIRWWNARDDLLTRPAQSRVPCVYAEGLNDHVNLQLLRQMLYRGRAPYTTCD